MLLVNSHDYYGVFFAVLQSETADKSHVFMSVSYDQGVTFPLNELVQAGGSI